MKRILIGLNLLFGAASLLAQGTLQFGNNFAGVFRAPIYGCEGSYASSLGLPPGTVMYSGPLLQGTGYTMALFAGRQGASDSALALVASTTFRTATGNVLPAGW